MVDLNTSEVVVNILKKKCVLRSVLVEDKACPKVGSSGNLKECPTCTYNWMVIAQDVTGVIEKRRVNLEKVEHDMKLVLAQMEGVKDALEAFSSVPEAFGGVLSTFAETMKNIAEKIPLGKKNNKKKEKKEK